MFKARWLSHFVETGIIKDEHVHDDYPRVTPQCLPIAAHTAVSSLAFIGNCLAADLGSDRATEYV